MKLFDALKRRFTKKKKLPAGEQEYDKQEEETSYPLRRDMLNIKDAREREQYVKSCCEQMLDAERELERAKLEYQAVTDYLTDIEEIEALPQPQQKELVIAAKKIVKIDKERKRFQGNTNRMTNMQYALIDNFNDEIPDSIEKLKEQEEYQSLVQQDLHYLEGEKGSLTYRKYELRMIRTNARVMSVIFLVAAVLTFLMLFLLKTAFSMNTDAGFIITGAAVAAAVTGVFIRSTNAAAELKRVERDLNKVIILQNKIKIKYVNVTNLIEYLYSKYNVNSAYELRYIWEKYQEERSEREQYQKTASNLSYHQEELLGILKRYKVKDPSVWIGQVDALIDNREMVEIRHNLIVRRQKLRKSMEYNKENMEIAKTELQELIREHPEYAKEVLRIVNKYEG